VAAFNRWGILIVAAIFAAWGVSSFGSGKEKANGLARARLRVARPTDDIEAVVKFYRDGLGFEVLSQFKGHDGFDGVMLGHKGAAYHLEFTRKKGHKAGKSPTKDNLLVFYLPDETDWKRAIDRMAKQGHKPVKSFNPYWDRQGKTFEDPDGYRVVLQNARWSK
jgi:catechol 2,3-dioxygenase-like lactoylglutathione lyase family enzyme